MSTLEYTLGFLFFSLTLILFMLTAQFKKKSFCDKKKKNPEKIVSLVLQAFFV